MLAGVHNSTAEARPACPGLIPLKRTRRTHDANAESATPGNEIRTALADVPPGRDSARSHGCARRQRGGRRKEPPEEPDEDASNLSKPAHDAATDVATSVCLTDGLAPRRPCRRAMPRPRDTKRLGRALGVERCRVGRPGAGRRRKMKLGTVHADIPGDYEPGG
jgi:hypothetical protein